jgi:hypothetical protein
MRASARLLTTAKSSGQPVCLTHIFHHNSVVTDSRHVNRVWRRWLNLVLFSGIKALARQSVGTTPRQQAGHTGTGTGTGDWASGTSHMGTGRRAHAAAATAVGRCELRCHSRLSGPALRWNGEVKSAHETIPYRPRVHRNIGSFVSIRLEQNQQPSSSVFLSQQTSERCFQHNKPAKRTDRKWPGHQANLNDAVASSSSPNLHHTNPTNDTGGRAAPMHYARLPQQRCSCSAGEICRRQRRRCSVFGVAT